mmetsp:Transcript_2033/g.2217  ORF Transcript_2033/g.2217 Transcript_2033/m.2217 type:complete len:819 (-) Transcript_2033:52-2508(-)
MRDSNYKSVSNNKAAVTITTSLYDRRALDVTSDKPLVNSLNHLTYLVSSLAKVRETLSIDGGIERLIEILHECHNLTFNLNDNIFNSEKKLLTAWKWTLAFQCLVLIGTRGTEKIRQGLVKAGILPIIATVLDNYLTLHERTFIHANSRLPATSNDLQLQNQTQHPQQTQASQQRQQMHQIIQPQQNNDITPTSVFDNTISPLATAPGTADGNDSFVVFNSTNNNNNNLFAGDLPSLDQETNNDTNNILDQLDSFAQVPMAIPNTPASTAGVLNSVHNSNQSTTFFNNIHSYNLTSDDYDNLTVDQLFKLIRVHNSTATNKINETSVNNDLRRRYLIINIIKKLREEKEGDILDDRFIDDCDYDMDNSLQFLSDMYLQDDKATQLVTLTNSKISPRNFTETGVVIPRDDDIVWSLQLLAYISKYPYLKDVLQNTHLVIDMSIRDKQLKLYIEKQLKSKLKKTLALNSRPTIRPKSRKNKALSQNKDSDIERFNPSASNSPQMLNDFNSIQNDDLILRDKFELSKGDEDKEINITEIAETDDFEDDDNNNNDNENDKLRSLISEDDCEDENYIAKLTKGNDSVEYIGHLSHLYGSILDAESIINDLDREIALFYISERINRYIEVECKSLSDTITSKRLEQKLYLTSKWNYDTYDNFDIDDDSSNQKESDYDESLVEYKKVNLFPMVEKFTFLSGTDMYYWSGVIMRNSCRRNEIRGGVRQCGNLECGKWEKYPREFLKCRRCKRTKYCSRECQMRAWHCHRNWCIPSNSSSGSSITTGTNNVNTSSLHTNMNPNATSNDDAGSIQNTQQSSSQSQEEN